MIGVIFQIMNKLMIIALSKFSCKGRKFIISSFVSGEVSCLCFFWRLWNFLNILRVFRSETWLTVYRALYIVGKLMTYCLVQAFMRGLKLYHFWKKHKTVIQIIEYYTACFSNHVFNRILNQRIHLPGALHTEEVWGRGVVLGPAPVDKLNKKRENVWKHKFNFPKVLWRF